MMDGVDAMNHETKKSKMRSLLVGLGITLMLSAVIFRLFWIQTVSASFLREQAQKTWEKKEVIQPNRGSILDRTGEVSFAESVDQYVIAADLSQVKNPRKTARELATVMEGFSEEELYQRLTKKGVRQVELKRKGNFKVSREVRDRIIALGLDGIYPIQTTGRQYPQGKQAAQVLGFLNVEGKPGGGLEQQYDSILKGHPGNIRFEKDAKGNPVPNSSEDYQPPDHGKNLVLTLDAEIQYTVEKTLDEIMAEYGAKGATAIVADPNNGEILAMASRPTFNPNEFDRTLDENNSVNRGVSTQYEPGSTFKIVTLAAAVEEGLFQPEERFQSGSIQVAGQTIRDWNESGWGEISYARGIHLSSNVAFVHLGEKLGADRLIRYIDRFGFGKITDAHGRKTGLDLPGEEAGYYFGHSPLHGTELATTAFGQGIAVTPIQQVMAVSAVANGGTLYRPWLVKEIRDPQTGKPVKKHKPYPVRREVISKKTAGTVRELLRGVVTEGTGRQAEVEGYQVAGKTGTAQKPREDGRGYAPGKYIVSFIGFAPAKNPKVVVYVAVDEPARSAHGGTVAAPAAGRIIGESLRQLGVPKAKPSRTPRESASKRDAADWTDRPVDQVKKELKGTGVKVNILGSGKRVIHQYPAPGESLSGGTVLLLTESPRALEMPDLTGRPLREAMEWCRLLELKPEIRGEGFVTRQSIPPGDPIMDQTEIRLELNPDSG